PRGLLGGQLRRLTQAAGCEDQNAQQREEPRRRLGDRYGSGWLVVRARREGLDQISRVKLGVAVPIACGPRRVDGHLVLELAGREGKEQIGRPELAVKIGVAGAVGYHVLEPTLTIRGLQRAVE